MQLGHRAGRAIGGCRRAGTGSVHRGKGLRRHTGGDGCSLPWATGVAGPRPRLASRSDGLALAGLGVFGNRGRWRLGRLWLPGLGGGGVAREVRIVASFGAHELAPGVENILGIARHQCGEPEARGGAGLCGLGCGFASEGGVQPGRAHALRPVEGQGRDPERRRSSGGGIPDQVGFVARGAGYSLCRGERTKRGRGWSRWGRGVGG